MRRTFSQTQMVRLFTVFLFAFAFILSAARGDIIRSVKVVNSGPGQVDDAFVMAHVSVQPGQELDRMAVSRDVKTLLETARFSDVNADAVVGTNGIDVVYRVNNRYRLSDRPSIVGANGYSEKKVREVLAVQPGDYIDDPLLAAQAAKLREEYRKDLYPDIAIQWQIIPDASAAGVARVVVQIEEGQRVGIYTVTFKGNDHVPESELRKAMELPQKWNPFYWFSRKPYDAMQVDSGRDSVRGVYVNHGYLDAVIGSPDVKEYKPGKLSLEVPIAEGPLYRINDIKLIGAKLFPEEKIRYSLELKKNDPAAGDTLFKAAQDIGDYYESRGYMDTVVTPVLTRVGTSGLIDVTLKISEGKLTHIRNIFIRGNSRTKDKVIRRELLIYPGEIFDGVRIRKSENRLRNLGYFEVVDHYPEKTLVPDESDLIFQVEEKSTGQFMVGAGFSSVDNLIGFAEVSQGNFDLLGWPNFVGGGQKLKLRAEVGSTRQDYTLSLIEPWFLDRRLSLGIDLYSQDRSYDDYDVTKLGGAVGLGMSLGGPYRLDFKYRLEHSEISDASDTNAYVDEEGEVFYYSDPEKMMLSSLSTTLSRDTRNNAVIPSRGSRSSISGTIWGGPLGFDTDLYSVAGMSSWYFPMPFGHILSLRLRAEVIDAYGETEDVPLSERLFAGGPRTIRGFEYREVGPKAVREDGTPTQPKPTGGRSLAVGNLEYNIPLASIIRLAAFADIGNVWYDPFQFDLNDYAASYGFGIRFDIPNFPIRLDYAWPLRKDDPSTQTERWSFSIGYGF